MSQKSVAMKFDDDGINPVHDPEDDNVFEDPFAHFEQSADGKLVGMSEESKQVEAINEIA